MHIGYSWKGHRERNYQQGQDISERIILKCILDRKFAIDDTDLDQVLDQLRTLVNVPMNLRIKYNICKLLSKCTSNGFCGRSYATNKLKALPLVRKDRKSQNCKR
jgi:hypothetical protein